MSSIHLILWISFPPHHPFVSCFEPEMLILGFLLFFELPKTGFQSLFPSWCVFFHLTFLFLNELWFIVLVFVRFFSTSSIFGCSFPYSGSNFLLRLQCACVRDIFYIYNPTSPELAIFVSCAFYPIRGTLRYFVRGTLRYFVQSGVC